MLGQHAPEPDPVVPSPDTWVHQRLADAADRVAGGHRLGALCVMDREPRRLREREMRALGELAAIAMEEIRRR